jgi:LysR family transcriptional regulator for bpeEF and oprC
MPGIVVAEQLSTGALVEVAPDMRSIRWPLSIMYPNRQHLAPQVRAFIDWVTRIVASSASDWLHPTANEQ